MQSTNEFDLTDADHDVTIKELHKQLEPLMLRRLKRDVLALLPTKSERILGVEMSAMQTHFDKNILTKVCGHWRPVTSWRRSSRYQNFQALVKSANGNNNISLLNIGEYHHVDSYMLQTQKVAQPWS